MRQARSRTVSMALALAAAGWAGASRAAPPAPQPAPAAVAPVPTGAYVKRFTSRPFHGDLDALRQRGAIRVAVTYSKTQFFIDRGQQRGATAEAMAEFEKFLRKRHPAKSKGRALSIVLIPVPRDELLARLQDGRADMAAGNLTLTPERQVLVDFTVPLLSGVREVLVTAPGVAQLTAVEQLSGREVVVRPSSSFREHLEALNQRLTALGRPPVRVIPADEHLETEDLLEMVSAGLIEATVADEHLVELWKAIFPGLQAHGLAPLAEGGEIAWAVRKDAPKLLAEANAFVKSHRVGTSFGNILLQRYLKDPRWAKRAMEAGERQKFDALGELFRRYGERYGFDHLLLLAQGYQESGLDQRCKSPVGAVGVMQLMPPTGASMRVGDIHKLEPNVHAGAKYLHLLIAQYFSDPAIDDTNRVLFAFAAYNAGPNRVQRLRRQAARAGLDPNVWFANVEVMAAREVGLEPVHYVSNISKYYTAYRMVENRRERDAASTPP